MSSITSLDDLVSLTTGGGSAAPQLITRFHDNRVAGSTATAPVANRWISLWQYDSTLGAGSAPGAGAIPDNTTNGSSRQTDPGGGRQLWLTGVGAFAAQAGTLMLYDRLYHISGLSGTSASAQTVQGSPASPALTRYTDGAGLVAFVEIYSAIGATARTITMDYTDQDGNTGQTSTAVSIGGTGLNEAQRMIHLQLAAGDSGLRAINTVTLSASTGTAGNFGITIAKPLAMIPLVTAGATAMLDLLASGFGPVEVKSDACLAWAFNATSTLALQNGMMMMNLVEK